MPVDESLTPARRDALLAVLAVGMLLAPLWVPGLHLDDPEYRYESVEVEADGTQLRFATEPEDPLLGLSERIACAGDRWGRACVFEHFVATNHSVPTRIYANPDREFRDDVHDHRYQFVLINGTVYEVGAVPNASVTGHGGRRLDLGLRPVPAERALRYESVDVQEVPPPVRQAARTGSAIGYVEDLPDTPIELDDGTYRRVYIAETNYPADHERGTESLLTYGLPVIGLGLLGRSWARFDVDLSVRHVNSE